MVHVSTARKLSILARILANRTGQTKTVTGLVSGAKAAAVHFGRALGQLWLEVTGFIFFGIAAIAGFALVREFRQYQAGDTGLGRVLLALGVALMFGWFGFSSFVQAAKKKKER